MNNPWSTESTNNNNDDFVLTPPSRPKSGFVSQPEPTPQAQAQPLFAVAMPGPVTARIPAMDGPLVNSEPVLNPEPSAGEPEPAAEPQVEAVAEPALEPEPQPQPEATVEKPSFFDILGVLLFGTALLC